jgi:hypothetical protein
MRPIGLALLVLGFSASPASAAVISIDERSCGCDGSSGEEDTRAIVVTAAPGEQNALTVSHGRRGIVIQDAGAPLTGACRPTRDGSGRFCRGAFDGVDVALGDRNDSLLQRVGGAVDAGAGDDDIRVLDGIYQLTGGPGADRLDANGAIDASVSYADHTAAVTVRLNGLADDGAAGEGDNVLGNVTGITGGSGDDRLEAGPTASGLFGEAGDDALAGSPQDDSIDGGDGDDSIDGRAGNDHLTGDAGADDLRGGDGFDEASYTGTSAPLTLTIGDGANDGAAGENDDIHADIEALAGGDGNDVLVGTAGPNRLIAFGGQDVLRGGAGPDELIGWDDGDELNPGPGPDRVQAGARDRALLMDGDVDRLDCRKQAPAIEADALDLLRSCAPQLLTLRSARLRPGAVVPLRVLCARQSALPCRGTLRVTRLHHGRRVSRAVRVGPLDPGERARVRVRLGRAIPPKACLAAVTRTRRTDGLNSVTVTRGGIGCSRV